MILLDGKQCAKDLLSMCNPADKKICIVQVGNDDASDIYVRNKIKKLNEIGLTCIHLNPPDIQEDSLIEIIDSVCNDCSVTGVMVQLPLPNHIDKETVLSHIIPSKDIDGLNPLSAGLLYQDYCEEYYAPCTPLGIIYMLSYYNIPIKGKHCVIVGRSNIVGKPMASLILNNNATVTICHSHTTNLKDICKLADILIVGIGKPNFITDEYVKDGAIVIDAGINRDENNKICGDVDFESVKDKVYAITPVPGGVGPMTIATLVSNACI